MAPNVAGSNPVSHPNSLSSYASRISSGDAKVVGDLYEPVFLASDRLFPFFFIKFCKRGPSQGKAVLQRFACNRLQLQKPGAETSPSRAPGFHVPSTNML